MKLVRLSKYIILSVLLLLTALLIGLFIPSAQVSWGVGAFALAVIGVYCYYLLLLACASFVDTKEGFRILFVLTAVPSVLILLFMLYMII